MTDFKEYTLGSICSRLSSGKGIPASQVHDVGAYPVYGGNGLRGYTDHSNFTGECAIIGRQGAFCGNVRYFSGEAYMTEHAVVTCANANHNTRYLAYLLSTMNLGRLSGQSAQPGLSVKTLSMQPVRMPPKETQDRVVAILAAMDDKIAANDRINDNFAA
ncbi:MAG: restriction endonuclease subunit S [Clostridia bacterium]|nr:restriction endonuclease subunit S [Clostridia bacterium]